MTAKKQRDDRIDISPALVKRLIAAQFPQWAALPARPVVPNGWDNRTFHLGDELSVRLPSHQRYAAQVAKEHQWLPVLAPQLPLPIPVPIAMGNPTEEYPYPWSVYRWIEGEPASQHNIREEGEFARDLAHFLKVLYAINAQGGPPAGAHNFHRGGALQVYHQETLRTIGLLGDRVNATLAAEIWQKGLHSTWQNPPVWVHGDVSASNLLVRDGRLQAVIDFGSAGVGDPACDLVIAWTFLTEEGRKIFRRAMGLDDGTWARARSWALWKALIVFYGSQTSDPVTAQEAQRVIEVVMKDHRPS